RWVMSLADCLLVQSQFLARVFARHGFATVVIPNHIDVDVIPHYQRLSTTPRILVPRALEHVYNIECALRTFRIVQNAYPRAELTILGEGPLRGRLEQLATDLGLHGVTFAGRVERDNIFEVFRQHDLILNTSSIDNMPLSLLEGMAAGLPIVT